MADEDSEKIESSEVEEVDVEDVKLLIDPATPSMQRTNPERKTARKLTVPEVVPSKTNTASASAGESKAKTSDKSANAELVAEQRYESLSSREIIPERSVDL